jgi:NADPH:quinone reductase-like Zn-dependent oxidoreductase
MKAIVYSKYGSPDVLALKEVARPFPKEGEVLVKVLAISVNAGDLHLLRASPFPVRFMSGFFKPKFTILGTDVAGRVEAVGAAVKQFQVGDEVFGNVVDYGWGGFAEYVCAGGDGFVMKPPRLSFEEAAAVPMAATTALQGLRDHGKIQPGQKVLINGASGGVGTFAVQIAKSFGTEVTAVCSTKNVETALSIGADHVIDYTQEDFTKNGRRYDLILAANGYHPISDYKHSLSPSGIYVMSGGSGAQTFQAMVQMGPWVAKPNHKDLVILKELADAGKIKPVIDRRYPLSEVPDALRYLEEGHARGKVVITVEQNNQTQQSATVAVTKQGKKAEDVLVRQ